jgi:glutamate synthase domain-containing protein 3
LCNAFRLRNSGATAVVEGVGDHGCEYMTGGTVLVLGGTGKNFGAGMTGGIAYVLDLENKFESLYNPALVVVEPLAAEDEVPVRELVYRPLENTEIARAREILGAWPTFAGSFRKVRPRPPAAKPEAKDRSGHRRKSRRRAAVRLAGCDRGRAFA